MRTAIPSKIQYSIYKEIASALAWNETEDFQAAEILRQYMIRCSDVSRIRTKLHGHPSIVVGAGSSARSDVKAIKSLHLYESSKIIAADGASRTLLEFGIVPDVIVTDLDGQEEWLVKAFELGSLMVVHAHGDNIPLLHRLIPRLKPILGTCQVTAKEPLFNLGGIMDGDRAVCLAVSACSNPIILAGMDLDGPAGPYSSMGRRSQAETTIRLSTSKKILEVLHKHTKKSLYNATFRGGHIEGFTSISWTGLARRL